MPPIVFLETDVLTWKETLSFFTPRTIFSEQPDIRLSPEESQPGKKTLKDGVCSRRKEVLKKVPELKAKEQRMRRGQKLIHKVKSLKIFLTNAAGLFSKLERITNKLKYFDAGIFTIQESHFTTKGKLKLDDFDIFESIRNKVGGGSMIGIHSSLNGKLVSEYSDEFELLVVQATIAKK